MTTGWIPKAGQGLPPAQFRLSAMLFEVQYANGVKGVDTAVAVRTQLLSVFFSSLRVGQATIHAVPAWPKVVLFNRRLVPKTSYAFYMFDCYLYGLSL